MSQDTLKKQIVIDIETQLAVKEALEFTNKKVKKLQREYRQSLGKDSEYYSAILSDNEKAIVAFETACTNCKYFYE